MSKPLNCRVGRQYPIKQTFFKSVVSDGQISLLDEYVNSDEYKSHQQLLREWKFINDFSHEVPTFKYLGYQTT